MSKELDYIAELEKENKLAKSLLYCTVKSCDNCGYCNCENFQRQRKSVPCDLYISYQDRIKRLEKENEQLKEHIEKVKYKLKKIIETVQNDRIDEYGERLILIYDFANECLQEI